MTLPTRLFRSRQAQWQAVIERVQTMRAVERPVLIGTDGVADSETLSRLFTAFGVPHEVLNAKQDRREAEIVAKAGERGAITIATNMAGRGTDIPLGAGVAALGGLHVICCQHNAAHRIDRQLHGRCSRQGDPGSIETILSFEGEVLRRHTPRCVMWALDAWWRGSELTGWRAELMARATQWIEDRRQRAQRRALWHQDRLAERRLSFGAMSE